MKMPQNKFQIIDFKHFLKFPEFRQKYYPPNILKLLTNGLDQESSEFSIPDSFIPASLIVQSVAKIGYYSEELNYFFEFKNTETIPVLGLSSMSMENIISFIETKNPPIEELSWVKEVSFELKEIPVTEFSSWSLYLFYKKTDTHPLFNNGLLEWGFLEDKWYIENRQFRAGYMTLTPSKASPRIIKTNYTFKHQL
jgi:hypothetical protein